MSLSGSSDRYKTSRWSRLNGGFRDKLLVAYAQTGPKLGGRSQEFSMTQFNRGHPGTCVALLIKRHG
jgi:hypothetical protein